MKGLGTGGRRSWRAQELEGKVEDLPRRKKARVGSNDVGSLAALTGEADKGLELPEAPCKRCEHVVGAWARLCWACYHSKQKCEGAVWGASTGLIRGPKETKVEGKASLAKAHERWALQVWFSEEWKIVTHGCQATGV